MPQTLFSALLLVSSIGLFAGSPAATAGIIIEGREWYQPADLYGISWDSFASVCDTDTGQCSGSVNGEDLTGWVWSDRDNVNALFNYFLAMGGITGDDLLSGVDSYSDRIGSWRQSVYDAGFVSTNTTPTTFIGQITGTLRDVSADNEFGLAQLSFDIGYSYSARSGWTEPFPAGSFPQLGAWVFREAEVPVPGTIALMLIALVGCLGWRRTRLSGHST